MVFPPAPMPTQYCTVSSLDGFIAAADDTLDWLFQLGDVDDTGYPAFIREVGALAMGSGTCDWMLRHVVGPGGQVTMSTVLEKGARKTGQ